MDMHLFLYQAARHQKSVWGGRRLSQSTIRSDFDLELLKRGIKGRYEILGHGNHPWQVAMKNIGMEEEFYGHVIAIEDSRNAVWFKLNYDNIGKNTTKYLGGWKDLNPDDIADEIEEYRKLVLSENEHAVQSSLLKSQYYYLSNLINPRYNLYPHMEVARQAAILYKAEVDNAASKMQAEISKIQADKAILQEKVRDYLKAHKG